MSTRSPEVDTALRALGHALQRRGYRFVTVTPSTHARVLSRARRAGRVLAASVRDVFGWSMPFAAGVLPDDLLGLLRDAGACRDDGECLRSTVRFSTVGARIFVHSAFPTDGSDAVFFGPDTYRFCRFLAQHAPRARRVVDVGCGCGVGGIVVAHLADHVVLADVNPRALSFARVNAELAGVAASVVQSDVLDGVHDECDLVIANPPYMADPAGRSYRDGGGARGEALSVRITLESLRRLPVGGTLLVYTGAPIVDGRDTFHERIAPDLAELDASAVYEELDPDVFGEELDCEGYEDVERIAVVGLRVTLR